MNAILARTGNAPTARIPQRRGGHMLARLLSAALHATLTRRSVPQPDLAPEFSRFPMP